MQSCATEQKLKNMVSGIRQAIAISGLNDEHLESLQVLCKEATKQRFVQNTSSLTLKANSTFDKQYWFSVSKYIKVQAEKMLSETRASHYAKLCDDMLLWEAPHSFESYLLYMEKDRKPEKRFYWPRRKSLKIVVDDLQRLEDGELDFYGLSMPPRVGKSSICIFYLSWVMGRHPNSHNAMGGHSGILAKGFYKEICNIITSKEYHYLEIFPHAKVQDRSSEDFTVNLAEPDRFSTLTCRGIDGTWTGAVDISSDGMLYVDDLIRDREESLSPIRLETKYQAYLNVMVDRKNDGAKELMVGTRWNLYDPLGRQEERQGGNPRALFRKIPALDEHEESNFDYEYGVGFSTEYYRNMRDLLDANEWEAKYQQKPFVREGLVLPEDELQYFNGVLPDGERSIGAACDVAFGGGDSLSMPVGVKIDGKIYVTDWVFNNGDKFVTRPLVTQCLLANDVSRLQVEGNTGGTEYAEDIDEMVRGRGGKISITTPRADNQKSKNDKIIQYSADVKRNFVFLDRKYQKPEYHKAFSEMTTYTAVGKNAHDDAIDSIVQLDQLMDDTRKAKIQAVFNPFML